MNDTNKYKINKKLEIDSEEESYKSDLSPSKIIDIELSNDKKDIEIQNKNILKSDENIDLGDETNIYENKYFTKIKDINTVNSESKMLTHESLIDLGKSIANIQFNKNLEIKKISDFECYIKSLLEDNDQNLYRNKKSFNELLNNMNDYILNINKIKNDLNQKIQKLNDENNELKNDLKEQIKENDEDLTKYNANEEKYKNRIINLRNKCIQKNKIKKYLILSLILSNLFSITNFLYIFHYGLNNYIFKFNYCFFNFLNIFYFIIFYSFKYLSYILNIILINNLVYLSDNIFNYISKYINITECSCYIEDYYLC